VAARERVLRVSFEDAEAFQREYAANLANGGVFVAGEHALELRERVRVELDLSFCGQRCELTGEIVHLVTREMARMGAPAGAAVQFDGTAGEVREQLEPLRGASGAPEHRTEDPGRRCAPRTPARVLVEIRVGHRRISGHTRNLSLTGVLVSVQGQAVPAGTEVRIALRHPSSSDRMEVDARVVRAVETDGGISAIALEFQPTWTERAGVERFVEAVQTAEHARRLGGITGDIAEVGIQGLLQRFATTAPAGTLTLRSGEREGVVGFDEGTLRFVRLGPVSGMKALVRLLGWSEGSFEFHARLDPVPTTESPVALDAALLQAVRMLDETYRPDRRVIPGDATPKLLDADAAGSDLSKVEAAVLDLVRAGFTMQRMVDVIPEPDPEIHRALESLCDRGAVCI
jgi:Tfp pilus assembly protein PilZ